MLFLILGRVVDGTTTEQILPFVKPEAAKVWEYYAADRVRSVYYFADISGAMLMYDAANLAEVEAAVAAFPMAKAGVLRFEIIPLKPYLGIEQLFVQ